MPVTRVAIGGLGAIGRTIARKLADGMPGLTLVCAAVREAVTSEAAENLSKMKKDALVAEAARRLEGRRWLPTALRRPATAATPATAAFAEAAE